MGKHCCDARAVASREFSSQIVVGPRTDALTAYRHGDQPGLVLARKALILDHDPRLLKRYSLTRELHASPGLSKPEKPGEKEMPLPIERDWLVSATRDEKGRFLTADFTRLPVSLAGLRIPVILFVAREIIEMGDKVIVIPDMETLRPSLKAPAISKWCKIDDDAVFEAIDNQVRKTLAPIQLAFPWINEDASIGSSAIYGDATSQGVQLYYPLDYRGQYLRLATQTEREQQLTGDLITERMPLKPRLDTADV